MTPFIAALIVACVFGIAACSVILVFSSCEPDPYEGGDHSPFFDPDKKD